MVLCSYVVEEDYCLQPWEENPQQCIHRLPVKNQVPEAQHSQNLVPDLYVGFHDNSQELSCYMNG